MQGEIKPPELQFASKHRWSVSVSPRFSSAVWAVLWLVTLRPAQPAYAGQDC